MIKNSNSSLVKILFPEEDPIIDKLKTADKTENFKARFNIDLIFKPMDLESAAQELTSGNCDVVIAGAVHDSADVIRSAIFYVNKPLGIKEFVSSFFIMEKEGQEPLFFADCAVNEKPAAEQLAKIAEQTSKSVNQLGYEPIVAFLSLSSFGSASHLETVQKITEAATIFKKKIPDVTAYGEIQVDAALDKDIFIKKSKGKNINLVDGKMPNVFIFPDGQSGNIAYKLVERLAGYRAIGPILNGVAKDWHDLSRGVSYESLVRTIDYTARLYRARQKDQ